MAQPKTQPRITVYEKPHCSQCTMTKKYLDRAARTYTRIDITTHADALDYVKSLGYLAAPVITVSAADGSLIDHWSGFQPDKLAQYI